MLISGFVKDMSHEPRKYMYLYEECKIRSENGLHKPPGQDHTCMKATIGQ